MLNPLVSVLVCSLGWGISPIFAKKSMENMSHMISTAFYGLFFGLIISLIGCYMGMTTKAGARGVGVATKNSVVLSLISVFVLNYFLSTVLGG